MLKFFGRGAGFSDEHNSACFSMREKLVIMDCPLVTFNRLKKDVSVGENYNEITALITHTHSDHIGGLSLMIHYARFIWKIKITVVAPSEEVKENLAYMLTYLDGCSKDAYSLVTAEEYMTHEENSWLKAVIPTTHVPELEGKCFGYNISVDGTNTVYTGDTNTLEPFIPYLTEESELYTECSAYDTKVHMYVEKLLGYEEYFRSKHIKVYLMHLDDAGRIEKIVKDTDYKIAPLLQK